VFRQIQTELALFGTICHVSFNQVGQQCRLIGFGQEIECHVDPLIEVTATLLCDDKVGNRKKSSYPRAASGFDNASAQLDPRSLMLRQLV
jgi:hypothetical protein